MIDYVEIRNENLDLLGIIDAFNSVIWNSVYYGVGDFEVYTRATDDAIQLLQPERYITRPGSDEVGIIESVRISDSIASGLMIAAAGRFAKSMLDRRHIMKLSGSVNAPTILRGNVEENIRQLVSDHAIAATDARRNIPILRLGASAGTAQIIVDSNGERSQKQVSYLNLLSYSESVLREYHLGSIIKRSSDGTMLEYIVFEGTDRSTENQSGNAPIVFSKEFDNLSDSEYSYDETAFKNAALIGGAGEGLERYYRLVTGGETGLARRETWVDAADISRTYNEGDGEQQYTDAEYNAMLETKGLQALSASTIAEEFSGTLDITNGNYTLNDDFRLGDLVTVQNTDIGKYMHVRIIKVTEVQDENGYTVNIEYGSDNDSNEMEV